MESFMATIASATFSCDFCSALVQLFLSHVLRTRREEQPAIPRSLCFSRRYGCPEHDYSSAEDRAQPGILKSPSDSVAVGWLLFGVMEVPTGAQET